MKEIIKKYFTNEATDKEKLKVLEYIRNPEGYKYFKYLKKEWSNSVKTDFDDIKTRNAFNKFQANVLEQQEKTNKKLIKYNFIYKYASIIILFLFVSFLTYIINNRFDQKSLTTTLLADKGNVSSIMLPDSTTVWLNSESKLTYTSDYGKNNRNVTLKGQAYFRVTKNKNIPFIVKSKDFDIKVLGTVFSVKSYPNDKKSSVILEEGSIELHNIVNDDVILMKPGERIICDSRHILHKQVIENSKKYSAWHIGHDVFYNSTLKDVIKQLNRKYNCNIILDSKLNDLRVTFSTENSDLKESLDIISNILPVKIVNSKSVIYIK